MNQKLADLLPENSPHREAILKNFPEGDLDTLAKSFLDAKRAASVPRVPAKDAPPEDWDRFHDTLGRPQKSSDYKLPETNGTLKPVLESLRDVAWKKGLSQEQFDALATEAANVQNASSEKLRNARKAWESKVREQYGDKADAKIQQADATLAKLLDGDAEAMAVLREHGLDKHPALAQLLVKVGDAMADDSAPIGASPGGVPGPSGTELYEQITKIIESEEYNQDNHPRNAIAHAKVMEGLATLMSMGYTGLDDARLHQAPVMRIPDGRGGFVNLQAPPKGSTFGGRVF